MVIKTTMCECGSIREHIPRASKQDADMLGNTDMGKKREKFMKLIKTASCSVRMHSWKVGDTCTAECVARGNSCGHQSVGECRELSEAWEMCERPWNFSGKSSCNKRVPW